MSYILEALKKSQRERELGEVPTLAEAPYLANEKGGRGAYWGIVAVILALLATLIALYGAFGERLLSEGTPATPVAEATPELEPAIQPPAAAALEKDSAHPEERPKPVAANEATARPKSRPRPTSAPVTTPKPAAPPARSAATEPAPTPAPRLLPPVEGPEVPPDLVREVRQFEQQLRQQKPREPRQAQAPEPAAAPAEPPSDSVTEAESVPADENHQSPPPPVPPRPMAPNLAELPPAQQQSIPTHRLTVHVYSGEPGQRFVIINSRKMGEGDRSREGLLVAEITPDGVILEYQGQRFFQHR